jgi:hypothetical protein
MRASGPSRCRRWSSTAWLTIWLTTRLESTAWCSPSTAGRSPDSCGATCGARLRARSDCRPGLHSLRHYYASLLIRHGESIKTVQARLGHATAAETLDTYSHLWPDSDDRTREAIDSVLGNEPDKILADSLRTADRLTRGFRRSEGVVRTGWPVGQGVSPPDRWPVALHAKTV